MQFTTKRLLSESYRIIQNNKLFVFITVIILLGLNFLPALIEHYQNILSFVVTPLITTVSLYCGYMLTFEPRPKWTNSFCEELGSKIVKKYLPLLVATLLVGILVVIGFLFLIIPGMIMIIKYSFVLHAIVLKDKGIIEALKYSWRLTKGQFAQLVILLYFIPLVCFGFFWGAFILLSVIPPTIAAILMLILTITFIVFFLFYSLVIPQAVLLMFKQLAKEDDEKTAKLLVTHTN